ncbi:E3 ubiquitin ligase, variant 3 [Basidiobolus ranarum]|uniref:E3 ubiquitin ligase, variant 3 n=1 Tax=Basidiobolus ranarum TaxID=34480 RepID=A0ABR2W815_9FUNG
MILLKFIVLINLILSLLVRYGIQFLLSLSLSARMYFNTSYLITSALLTRYHLDRTRISEDTTFNSTNTMEQFDFPPSNYLSFLRNSALSASSFAPSIISNLDQDEHYVREEDGFSDIQDPPTIRRNPDLWVSEGADLSTTPTHSLRQNHRFGIPTSVLDWSEEVEESSILSDNEFSENGENSLVSHTSEDAETSLDTLSCHQDSDSNSLNSGNSRPLEYLGSNIAREGSENIYCSSPMIPCLSPPLEESFLHGASEITSECSSVNTRRFKNISSPESQCPNCGWHFSANGDVESTIERESSNHSDVISTTDSSSMTEQAQIADMYNSNGSSSDQQFSSDEDKDVSIFSDSLALQSQESYQNSDMEEFDSQVISDTHEYNRTIGLLIDQSSGLFSNMWDSALGRSDIQMNPSFLEQVFLDSQETPLQDSFAYDSEEDSFSSDINIQCNVEMDSLSSSSDES